MPQSLITKRKHGLDAALGLLPIEAQCVPCLCNTCVFPCIRCDYAPKTKKCHQGYIVTKCELKKYKKELRDYVQT